MDWRWTTGRHRRHWNRDIDRVGSQFGQIDVYAGVDNAWPDPAVISRSVTGQHREGRLGEAMAVVSDYTGDGVPEFVAHAARDSSIHYLAGTTYLVRSSEVIDPDDPLPPSCLALCDHTFECAQLNREELVAEYEGCQAACELRSDEYRACVLDLPCGEDPIAFATAVLNVQRNSPLRGRRRHFLMHSICRARSLTQTSGAGFLSSVCKRGRPWRRGRDFDFLIVTRGPAVRGRGFILARVTV